MFCVDFFIGTFSEKKLCFRKFKGTYPAMTHQFAVTQNAAQMKATGDTGSVEQIPKEQSSQKAPVFFPKDRYPYSFFCNPSYQFCRHIYWVGIKRFPFQIIQNGFQGL